MKRILLSTATVALVAFGACLLIGRQECAAVSNSLASTPVAQTQPVKDSETDFDVGAEPRRADAELNLAQATDPFEPSTVEKSTSPGEPAPPASKPKTAPSSFKRTIKVPVTRINYEDRVIEMAEVTPLQQQYSVLMLKRAQRMSEEELKTAIEELEAELKEQDEAADAELQKAVEILNQLQENSSGTPAARRAAEALPVLKGVIEQSSSSGGGAPTYSDPNEVQFRQPNIPKVSF